MTVDSSSVIEGSIPPSSGKAAEWHESLKAWKSHPSIPLAERETVEDGDALELSPVQETSSTRHGSPNICACGGGNFHYGKCVHCGRPGEPWIFTEPE